MFENIADDLSIMLVEKGIIKPENREFYFYGLHLAISKLFFFLVILVISLFTKSFLVSMTFVFMYSAIRQLPIRGKLLFCIYPFVLGHASFL